MTDASYLPAGECSISQRLQSAEREVLQIALLDRLSSAPVLRAARHSRLLAASLLGSLPIATTGIERLAGDHIGWFVWITAAIYGVLVTFMLFSAPRYWPLFAALGPDIDAIIDGDGRKEVLRRLNWSLSPWPQLVALACGAVFSTAVAVELTGPIGTRYLGAGALSYVVTIGWTGAVGAITAYWLWGAPATLYPLARTESPRLDWLAPAHTPAVEKSSRLMIECARFAAYGLFLFTIPIALTLALSSGAWAVWAFSISPIVLSLASVFGSSVIPMRALEALLRAGKANTLAAIQPYLPTPAQAFANPDSRELVALLGLYRQIAGAPVSLINWRRLTESVLLLLSVIVPIVIALISR